MQAKVLKKIVAIASFFVSVLTLSFIPHITTPGIVIANFLALSTAAASIFAIVFTAAMVFIAANALAAIAYHIANGIFPEVKQDKTEATSVKPKKIRTEKYSNLELQARDVLLEIVKYLSLKELENLARTSKTLYIIVKIEIKRRQNGFSFVIGAPIAVEGVYGRHKAITNNELLKSFKGRKGEFFATLDEAKAKLPESLQIVPQTSFISKYIADPILHQAPIFRVVRMSCYEENPELMAISANIFTSNNQVVRYSIDLRKW